MFTTTKDGRRANLTTSERLLVELERGCGWIAFIDLILGGHGATAAAYYLARREMVSIEGPQGGRRVVLTPKGRAAAQRLHVTEVH